jgi:hypothetical protein
MYLVVETKGPDGLPALVEGDLEFSQDVGACDPEVAARYREHVPK